MQHQKSPSTRAVNFASLLSRHRTWAWVYSPLVNVKLINTPPRNVDSRALTWRSDGSSPLYIKYFKCVLVFKVRIVAGQVQAVSPSRSLSTLLPAPHTPAPHNEMLNDYLTAAEGEVEKNPKARPCVSQQYLAALKEFLPHAYECILISEKEKKKLKPGPLIAKDSIIPHRNTEISSFCVC